MMRKQYIELLHYTKRKEVLKKVLKLREFDIVEDILSIYRISTSNENADSLALNKLNEIDNEEGKKLQYVLNIQAK